LKDAILGNGGDPSEVKIDVGKDKKPSKEEM
jgi:hypothetical protein